MLQSIIRHRLSAGRGRRWRPAYHPGMRFHPKAVALAGAMAMLSSVALADIFKCVDGAGRVTYQESPCGNGAHGTRVELSLDNVVSREAPEVEARWREAAARHEVTQGMPKRWVQQARGLPVQIRRGTANDAATEVWVYEAPSGSTQVGFAGNLVAWTRSEPRAMAASAATENADAARSRVAADRKCDEVLAEIGAPSTRENIRLPATDAEVVRYTYDPVAGGLPVRLTFTCADGRVVAVSRGVPR